MAFIKLFYYIVVGVSIPCRDPGPTALFLFPETFTDPVWFDSGADPC